MYNKKYKLQMVSRINIQIVFSNDTSKIYQQQFAIRHEMNLIYFCYIQQIKYLVEDIRSVEINNMEEAMKSVLDQSGHLLLYFSKQKRRIRLTSGPGRRGS